MNAAPDPLEAIHVVVPVHDEEELLPRCLHALRGAVALLHDAAPLVRVRTVLVLDGCTDGSADVARASGFATLTTPGVGVGEARRAGVDAVGRADPGRDTARVWLACTDGDSEVPEHWLVRHLELADGGADVVVGTVRPRLEELSADRADAWLASHRPGVANGHVHGANLGIRRSTYESAGGFAALREHEDVVLVDRARTTGARVVADAACEVVTSARLVGRTPGGYARHLREDLVPPGSVRSA
ncbi:glycosyltransferase family A protein [Isoptericola chiayiensis]|uniref:4,4'-diaponeurosporenoate glycosyltransferase n=1 Tax=Isoptericola chiayiensis TaxID=579446 RepID=A0ABP8YE00_9MICO|nr:glycosyltransferase involved in cell wall biosynthesis [Isoptericola chiayiensis]